MGEAAWVLAKRAVDSPERFMRIEGEWTNPRRHPLFRLLALYTGKAEWKPPSGGL